MKKLGQFLIISLCVFAAATQRVHANSFDIGPRRIAPAGTVNRGALLLSTQGRFYTARDIYTTPEGALSGITVWDSQLSAAVTFGLFRGVQLDFAPILMQKTHDLDDKTDSPGALFFAAQFALPSSSRFKTALRAEARVPGRHQNIALNPYSANALGFGGTAMISSHLIGKSPDKGLSLDFNLGYFNHNDRGMLLTDSPADTFQALGSQELRGGAALRWMGEQYGFYAEVIHRSFLTPPPMTAYSRENSTVLSSGVLYQFNPYILLTVGVDVPAAGRTDQTQYDLDGALLTPKLWQTLPNYPDWRANVGLTFRLAKGKTTEPKTKEKPKPKEKDEKKPEQIAVEKSEAKPKKKSKAKETTMTADGEKKVEITDVKELERRLRAQREQGVETEQQRMERILRERERMEVLLAQLHERLQAEAEAARLAAEEKQAEEAAAKAAAAKAAEEAKAAEAAKAAKVDETAATAEETEALKEPTPETDSEQEPEEDEAQASVPDSAEPKQETPPNDEPAAEEPSSDPSAADENIQAEPPTETDTTPE